MTKKGLIAGILSAFAFIGLYWLVLSNMTADDAFQFEEVIGLFFLSLVALGSIVILVGKSVGEVLFHVLEAVGDTHNDRGNTRAARLWYQRCIRLDDRLLNNTARRVQVMGKLSKIYDYDGHPELVHQLKLREEKALLKDKDSFAPRKVSVKESVESSFLYKYIFVIIFGVAAIVYSINSSGQTASMIFVFGVALNAYWLHSAQDDALS